MGVFLQIVLAVVLVLVVAVVVAFWAFKRWLRRKVGDFRQIAELAGQDYAEPARIRLRLATDSEPGAELERLWSQLLAVGLRPLADFSADEGEPELLRAARSLDGRYAGGVLEWQGQPHYLLFCLDQEQRLLAYSSGPGRSFSQGTLDWRVEPALDLAAAWQHLQQQGEARSLRPIDAPLFRQIYERAHARRMDALLAQPPHPTRIERNAAAQGQADPALVARAQQFLHQQWLQRVQEAVLDQFRHYSRMDAEQWERVRDDAQVVHAHLDAAQVRALLVEDAAGEQLWQQYSAQGLAGIELYEAINRGLPAARQRRRLGEVRVPLRALVYAGNDLDALQAPAARPHFYEATDSAGRSVQGAVLAQSSADAKAQLQAMDLQQPRVVMESLPLGEFPDFMLDPVAAAAAAKAAREGLPMAILRAVRGNLWLWAPPALWAAWSLYQGPAYDWSDYLGFGLAVLALLALLFLIAPMVLYNQLLQARVQARWASGRLCLALLRRLNLMGAISADQLVLEHCKLLAGAGDSAAALAEWARHEHGMSEAQYQTGLVQLHDAAGDGEAMIAAQRRVLALAPQDLLRIDLAMALAKYTREADEAEQILLALDPQGLSELALAGYHYCRGLIAQQRAQHAQAVRHFHQAIEQSRQFQNNPLVFAMQAEINAYVALALRRSGEHERAASLWRQVHPLLSKHPSCRQLIAQYEAA